MIIRDKHHFQNETGRHYGDVMHTVRVFVTPGDLAEIVGELQKVWAARGPGSSLLAATLWVNECCRVEFYCDQGRMRKDEGA